MDGGRSACPSYRLVRILPHIWPEKTDHKFGLSNLERNLKKAYPPSAYFYNVQV